MVYILSQVNLIQIVRDICASVCNLTEALKCERCECAQHSRLTSCSTGSWRRSVARNGKLELNELVWNSLHLARLNLWIWGSGIQADLNRSRSIDHLIFGNDNWQVKYLSSQVMGMYKLNKLHFHLTDDEGWRVEMPFCPFLTTVGATQ